MAFLMLLPKGAGALAHFLRLVSDRAASPGRVAVAAPGGGVRAAITSSCTALLLGYGGYVATGGGGGRRAAPSRCTASGDNAEPYMSDVQVFSAAMDTAGKKTRCTAMALIGGPTEMVVGIGHSARQAHELLHFILMRQPVRLPRDLFEEVVGIGTSFVELDGQCREGYIRADAMLAGLNGLKRMSAVFINSVDDLPPYAEVLPVSSKDVGCCACFSSRSMAYLTARE